MIPVIHRSVSVSQKLIRAGSVCGEEHHAIGIIETALMDGTTELQAWPAGVVNANHDIVDP